MVRQTAGKRNPAGLHRERALPVAMIRAVSTIGALARPLSRGGLTLWVCCALHLVNDACFALLFPLLPAIASDLSLSLAEAGLVKTAFSAASSLLQVPAGMLAERWGEYGLLVGGNAWVATGLVAMGLAGAFVPLLGVALAGGLGGNFQHPLAMSLVMRTAPEQRRGTVVGTLNLAGDVGKIAAPLLVLFVAAPYGWRPALIGLGVFGLLFSAAISRLPVEDGRHPRSARVSSVRGHSPRSDQAGQGRAQPAEPAPSVAEREAGRWGMFDPRRFATLALVGMLDGSTRSGALAFLPFLLVERGLDPQGVSL
ncbi:MAG: MFS transporter, partial [Chloroflexi bacterium]|nr:MFS transporter [Chloroflexota bacterium]